MTYNALDIARYILNYCADHEIPVSNLKLQKILYFIWVDYFTLTSVALFLDTICAWKLGPVVPTVYYEFCPYAGRSIPKQENFDESVIPDADKAILNELIQEYAHTSASELVNRTHQSGTPWDIVYQDGAGNREEIPFQLIEQQEVD